VQSGGNAGRVSEKPAHTPETLTQRRPENRDTLIRLS
jgi:hypothetical protein